MSRNLDTLEKIVSPYELVGALQLDTRQTPTGNYQAFVPGEGWFWLLDTGFLSTRCGSAFRAGSVVDLVALVLLGEKQIQGNRLYTAAIDKLSSLFPDRLSNFLTPGVVMDLAEEVRRRRAVFEIVSCDGMNPRNELNPVQQSLAAKLRSTGLDVRGSPYYASILNAGQVAELNHLLRDMELNPVPPGNTVVYPYYGNHHTVSYIKYSDSADGTVDGARMLVPCKYSVFGLLDHTPETRMTLVGGVLSAMRFNGAHKTFDPGVSACDVVYHPQHEIFNGYLPEHAEYVYDKESSKVFDLAIPASMVKDGVRVEVVPAGEPQTITTRKRQGFDRFVLDLVVAKIKSQGRVSKDTKAIIKNVNVGGDARQNLIKAIKQEDMAFALRDMEQLMPEGVVVSQGKKIIMSTLQGYTVIEPGAEEHRQAVSNFTLRFENNIVFPEVDAMYHTGNIMMSDREIPFMMHSSDLDSIKKLDAAVKQADILHPRDDRDNSNIPTFIDHSASRALLPNFRTQVSGLRVESGVSALGWDGMREVFTGRGFIINDSGCSYVSHTPHPTTTTFKFFDFRKRTEEQMHENLPEDVCDLMSQAVAMASRFRSGRKVSPVFIRNTPENEKMLHALFGGLGQTKPIPLNNNVRGGRTEIEGVNGFPVMAVGLDRSRRGTCGAPAFILSDAGYSFGRADTGFYEALGRVFHTVLVKSLSSLIRDTAPVKFNSSVLYENELVREGAALIRRAFGLVAWPQTELPYETLEQVLRSIPIDDIGEYFAHDLARQKVYFYYKDIAKKNQVRDLFLELSTLVEGLSQQEGYFEMDPQGVGELLNNFYQDDVRIAPINVGDLAAKLEALN